MLRIPQLRAWSTFVGGTLIALLSACGGSPIEGDWFTCNDTDCGELKSLGIRFGDDNEVRLLIAEGTQLEQGERYCHTAVLAHWTLDDDILRIEAAENADVETQTGKVNVDGDVMLMTTERETTRLKAVTDIESTACAAWTSLPES